MLEKFICKVKFLLKRSAATAGVENLKKQSDPSNRIRKTKNG